MSQETGETRDAIIEDDNKELRAIVAANKGKTVPYWIVLFAKPSKVNVDGKPTLIKYIKAYSNKPLPKVIKQTAQEQLNGIFKKKRRVVPKEEGGIITGKSRYRMKRDSQNW